MTKSSQNGQPLGETLSESLSEPISESLSDTEELSRATIGAMAGVVLSRLSGLVRQQILSAVFGAGVAMDAFYVAFRFPNALRDLLADGALSSAFTKTLVEAKAQGIEAERKLISVVLSFFGLITLLLAFLGFAFSRQFMALTTSDAFAVRGGLDLATVLFRILVFYLPLTMLSACAMAILGTHRKTFRATLASSFFNVGTIAGALVVAPLFVWQGLDGVYGLATGALLGGVLQFVYQAVPLFRLGILSVPKFTWRDVRHFKPLREILLLMGPRALSQGAMTLALLINTLLASSGKGTIAYISNAQIVILVPVGLFGVASGFSSLPVLTEAATRRDGAQYSRLLGQSFFGALWFAFFSVAGFAILSLPFCVAFFEHGRFSRADSIATATAICAYAIGVFFNSGSKVLQQGFFALGNTRQVAINSFVYLAVNASCSWLFSRFSSGPVPFGLSNSCAAAADFTLNMFFLERLCKASGFSFWEKMRDFGLSLGRVAVSGIAVLVMAGSGIVFAFHENDLFARAGIHLNFLWSMALMGCGGAVFGFIFILCTRKVGPEGLRKTLNRHLKRIGM